MFKSLKGHFLISAKHLKDENFFKTVVLMIEHNPEGAMGVVINRPTDLTIYKALQAHFEMPETELLLYSGGPVEENALLIIHNSTDHDQEMGAVLPDVFVGTSADIFDRVVKSLNGDDPELKFKIFAGYSGWSDGQLEGELERGDWFTTPASSEYVFRADPYDVWDDVLREFQTRHRILKNQTGSNEWN